MPQHLIRTLDPLLSTFPIHLTTHCISYESYVLYSILLYNVAVLCYIACHCLEEKQSCLSLSIYIFLSLSVFVFLSLSLTLFLSLDLSVSSVSPLLSRFLLSPSQASVLRSLLCVFFTILSLLSRPGMQVTYEFSLLVYHWLIYSQASADRCSIGCNLPLYLFFSWGTQIAARTY